LHIAIRGQAMRPFDPFACTEAIAELSITRPDTLDRLELAVARTMGTA
jgi:hypothetical protein